MRAAQTPLRRVIGLMSGTSFDGVDAAVLLTDGEVVAEFGPRLYRPYSDSERAAIRAALEAARARFPGDGAVAAAERVVTDAHIELVGEVLRDNGLSPGALDDQGAGEAGAVQLIGFHGQTILHAPERHLTVQIGDGQRFADATGIAVVSAFRAADVAAGGQGAPFVPVYHRALAQRSGLGGPLAVVNIGGVANVTWIGAGDELAASDLGPGSALIDDFVRARRGLPFDRDGALAAAGRVDARALDRLMAHPWFALPEPKSLDRDAFDPGPVAQLSDEDGAATLAAFTVRAIAEGVQRFGRPRQVVVAGGGAHNRAIMAGLAGAMPIPVVTAADVGWATDFIEAEAFAFLASRSARGLPLSYPATTGVPRPMPGGVLMRPAGQAMAAAAAASRRST